MKALVRTLIEQSAAPAMPRRTAGALRSRADAIRLEREREAAERQTAERKRLEAQAVQARRLRLNALAARGDGIWREIETEIERRNAGGYEKAAALLTDLAALAVENETRVAFRQRLDGIRERHSIKRRFIERIAGLR